MPRAENFRMMEFKPEAAPSADLVVRKLRIVWQVDMQPDIDYLVSDFDNLEDSCRYSPEDVENYGEEQVRQWIADDMARHDSYGEEWVECGIWAECIVFLREWENNFVAIPVRSAGLWGIDSDDTSGYVEQVAAEQLDALKSMLERLNPALIESWDEQAREALEQFEFMGNDSYSPPFDGVFVVADNESDAE